MNEEPSPQVAILDAFRGIAAVGILLYHCWLLSGEPSVVARPRGRQHRTYAVNRRPTTARENPSGGTWIRGESSPWSNGP